MITSPPIFDPRGIAIVCAVDPRLIAARRSGLYSVADHKIVLLPRVCNRLAELQSGAQMTATRYDALFLVAHELGHASGNESEPAANHYALVFIRRIARRLGIHWPKSYG